MTQNAHRSSALKQQNKKHNKLGHRTKGQVRSLSQGRVSVQSVCRKRKHELSREERRNQVKVIRAEKRGRTLKQKRKLGLFGKTPYLVCVLVLDPQLNPKQVTSALCNADLSAEITTTQQGTTFIKCHRFNQCYTLVVPPVDDLFAILDVTKVCTTLLVVWPPCDRSEKVLSDEQERLLSSIKAQGLPTPVHATLGFMDFPQKRRHVGYQNLLAEIQYYFPGDSKVKLYQLDKPGDSLLCLRQISAQKQRSLFFRDHRPHLLADTVRVQDEEGSATSCSLLVSGYLRGTALSVNSLLHVPGWEDYQLSAITVYSSPDDEVGELLLPNPDKQDSLLATRKVDDTDSDSEEVDEDESFNDSYSTKSFKSFTSVPIKKDKIPGAYSSYQAAWMMDNDAYKEGNGSGSGEDEFEPQKACPESVSEYGEDDKMSTVSDSELSFVDDAYDEKVDYDREMLDYNKKLEASKDDLEFPDEVDTPMDVPARERFHKYVPLESFRSSPWDLTLNLPSEYNNIYQISRFDQFRKKVMAAVAARERQLEAKNCGETQEGEELDDCASFGQYVTLHIKHVKKAYYMEHMKTGAPLVVFGLLPHEQKMSVLNITVKSHPDGHRNAIKSKERLIFHVGFRRFTNNPIFSEHTAGDKQKFCRFFHPGQTLVASMYAPVTYSPCSTLVFRERPSGQHLLVATGSIYSVNPERCVLKRIILSGHPFKIHKRTVVVRYMFFDRDDINWYKPVALKTKWGRIGKIKEPLGTHGHMKCQFNGILKSQDTVLLHLYKRVFPKWTYCPDVTRCASLYFHSSVETSDEATDEETNEKRDRALMPPPKKARLVHFR